MTSRKLQKYVNHPEIIDRFTNYRIRMGFGLHIGWGIEVLL